MVLDALEDLQQLEVEASQAQAARKPKKTASEETDEVLSEAEDVALVAFDTAYIVDYLERHLEMWDSVADTSTQTRPVQPIDFAETLRRYADAKQPHKQCCYCGSALKASNWMSSKCHLILACKAFLIVWRLGVVVIPSATSAISVAHNLFWRN